MPTVRQYEPDQVSTQITQTPSVNINTDTGIGAVTNAALNLTNTFKQIGMEVDKSRAEEALVNFERDKNKLLFDPDSGYFNTQGVNAYDGAKGTSESLAKLKESYSKGLTSQYAKDAFSKAATAHIDSTNVQIMRHAANGQKVYEQSIINARIENAKENVALNWNDGKEVGLYKEIGRQAIIDKAVSSGLSAEATAEEIQSFESETAASIIESALNNSSLEADAMFTKYGSSLEGNLGQKIRKAIDRVKAAELEQSLSSQAVIQAGAIVANSSSRTEILAEVNKIKDGDMRKKVMSEATYQYDQQQKADSEERITIFDTADKYKLNGGSINNFIAENPREWTKLSSEQQKKLLDTDKQETDFLAYTNFMSLPDETIKRFSNDDVENLLLSFPTNTRDDISRRIVAARTGKQSDNIPSTATSAIKIATETLYGRGVLGNTKDNDNLENKAQANGFLRFVYDEYNFRKSQTGRELSTPEVDDLIADVTRKTVTEKGIFSFTDTEKQLSELPQESLTRNSAILRDFGKETNSENMFELEAVITQLKKQGLPVTRDNISQYIGALK